MEKLKIEKLPATFTDQRGVITDILSVPLKHVCLITSKKGSVRASHYHKEQTQYTYVLDGKIELTTMDMREKNPKPATTIVAAGQLVSIPPMMVHKYVALEDYTIIALTTEHRIEGGYEADTIRVEV